jgi:hypothetical protein
MFRVKTLRVLKKGKRELKRTILLSSFLVSIVLTIVLSTQVFAAGPPITGTWEIGDRGPGGWAGGNLLSDGTLNGGGLISFHTPDGVQQIADIDVKDSTWQFTDSSKSAVNFCFTFIGKQGNIFPIGVPIVDCTITVPVGTNAPVQIFPTEDPDLYGRVTLVPSH